VDEVTEYICSLPATPTESSSQAITKQEQQEMIIAAAQKIEIDLPVEAITNIANSIEWAIASREEMQIQLVGAIRDWANHKIAEAKKINSQLQLETQSIFNSVNEQIEQAIATSNLDIEEQSQQITESVNTSIEKLRQSQLALVERFRL
jgi:hypothetical protein